MSAFEHGPQRRGKKPPLALHMTVAEVRTILDGIGAFQRALLRSLGNSTDAGAEGVVLRLVRDEEAGDDA